jgi:hypothetical protein
MKTKFLIIVGAGSTLSDAARVSRKNRPPLDKGFFANASQVTHSEFVTVRRYLSNTYDFDPLQPDRDSLESVMAMIYADIHNPDLESTAVPSFRSLIRLFNRRIAETTNELIPTNRSKLYGIICRALDDGHSPEEICIITFNQDIQIEKVLSKINETRRAAKYGGVFSFPSCYEIPNADKLISSPRNPVKQFPKGSVSSPTIRILKLHGSLNWFSTHRSKTLSKNQILNSGRRYYITPRMHIAPDLTYTAKRKMYTFPVIVPPVTHKAGILHQDIYPLWTKATTALKAANEIVVFGYSCPEMDFESANLIRRTIRSNTNLRYFSVVDPDPRVFRRYVDLTNLNRVFWFRSADSFLEGYV